MDKVTPIDSPKRKRNRSTRSQVQSAERWEKATQAYQLKVGGKLPSEIQEILGLAQIDEVYRLLDERFAYDASYLTSQERSSLLAEELMSLAQLKAAIWPAAMMGDPKSVDSAVKIILAAHKVAGMEQIDPVVNKNLVLVMGEKEEDFIAALRATRE
jgi:hypothetical protein